MREQKIINKNNWPGIIARPVQVPNLELKTMSQKSAKSKCEEYEGESIYAFSIQEDELKRIKSWSIKWRKNGLGWCNTHIILER